ncbi:MAG TPA: HEAT repeat domain-containing protein [Methanolinea sp.]|nr:HEAT repeat domain-containing protein [Methanolinea sp.]HRS93142.1 HEAT repeat domain-containing protein [Methanolinea sp.]HRU80585.1 HEAT repeat domain-containing protein [Methanolinea sp.]
MVGERLMMQNASPGPPLEPLLRDLAAAGIDARWRAARMLSARGNDAVDALIRCLYSNDPGCRLLAAWALGNIGDRKALPFLERLTEDDEPDVRLACECALGKIVRISPF